MELGIRMVKQLMLSAAPRVERGRNAVRKVHARGCVPAILYGVSGGARSIEVKRCEVEQILAHATGENLLVELRIVSNDPGSEEESGVVNQLSLIREVQHHPVNGGVLHVDFRAISATSKIEVAIPLEARGEAKGVKAGGGLLEQSLRVLSVECLPQNLPAVIQVDVTALDVGDSYHVRDIVLPEGVRPVTDAELAVFRISEPVTPPLGGSTSSPEVIKEKNRGLP
ncbi:50S ribosomal protein L25 [Candidatus Xiphinematobacter sp. Idaho Grape]|uniref:50S ribosomal protein L25 n=1 Tax=Candidatus Xiphinematobacter sp. Idaho Grape TaxID=1704307 RepID=UPI000783327C|nr:50S ribosomal protein L25 [Candidatus Xiphinematobacter sp. Idaho Grape]